MAREILVVRTENLFKNDSFQGFVSAEKADFMSRILSNFEYRERTEELEKNSSFKQPIPYIWLINPNTGKIFAYKRSGNKAYKETRLYYKWSCGIGGHVDKDTDEFSENPIEEAMIREMCEEIRMIDYPTPRIIGYLNDDSNDVGKVHFGILAIAETDENVEKGNEELEIGRFYSIEELEKIFSDEENEVEEWTRISWPFVKDYLLKSINRTNV